jgi:ATP-dependent Lhr-like helicase
MVLESFHPTVRSWFVETLGAPSPPQARGWPLISAGGHVLIAAPTGSGKTLAAFLHALDGLLREGDALPDETRVLYVSPLRALSNDVQKNLAAPLAALRERDPSLPDVRVFVRTGDTTQSARQAMRKRPPHVLVTTPESLYILLTSDGGRAMLRTVRTVIVDEIHAVVGSKRGSHLALSLERLDALCGTDVQRVGLSATQKPLADVGRFLGGVGREVSLVDEGHARQLDLAVEVPESPLETVCSHDTWDEIHRRVSALAEEHKTTLVFVGTRKMAERITARLAERMGAERVACHHSSLSLERRQDAERRLKAGELKLLVATASMELGIDIGDVELVVQIGATRSIAALLQRVGRAGHGVGRTPKGRLFPLTPDELVEAAALLRCIERGELDHTPQPAAPIDILLQQVVAECVAGPWDEDALFEAVARAWPYRDLERERFDATLALHAEGRRALLHRDPVTRRLRATRRARLTAITGGGAIPDRADYQVLAAPDGAFVGTIDEDFAVESSAGDVFQLGATSWRVLKVESGTMRVADAQGAPPSLPFWFGEAPARTAELSAEIGRVRQELLDENFTPPSGYPEAADRQLREYVLEGARVLGTVPTSDRLVLERFFDETGGTQLVLHAPLGARVNRAFGYALRKRFCRRFGFELQAAANEDAIVLSLGPHHSFPLEEVFDYLRADTVEALLVQAVLPTPLFGARWRWNVTRALVVARWAGGQRVPPPLIRMRAEDELARAFPDAVACGENLAPGDIDVPLEHPLVHQTIDDCLREAMDVDGLVALLERLRAGAIERIAVDVSEPSSFSRAVLNAAPYAFLDDAPLEERRTQAVQLRRVLDPKRADELGDLDPAAVERVRAEAWPDPRDAEELHEALFWMGFVTDDEALPWTAWLEALAAEGRVERDGERWFAVGATREPEAVLRGRMEALGPVLVEGLVEQLVEDMAPSDAPLLAALEAQGHVMRCRIGGAEAWCDRRLLARIHRYTLEGLRREIAPVPVATYLAFLARWQHVAEDARLEGPAGVREVVRQLAGFEAPAGQWEKRILAARVRDHRPDWLDQLGLAGEVVWGRLFGGGNVAPRSAPVCLLPREELEDWLALAAPPDEEQLSWRARAVRDALAAGGALFPADLARAVGGLPSDLDQGLAEAVGRGLVTSDSFAGLRRLLAPAHRRSTRAQPGRDVVSAGGRWSRLRAPSDSKAPRDDRASTEHVARVLLRRWGVVCRQLLSRERLPVAWRDLARVYRGMELAGEVRGGRFVAGLSGEQFALPDAVPALRRARREPLLTTPEVAACDPLNLLGILTPDARVPAGARHSVTLGAADTRRAVSAEERAAD